LIEEWNPTYIIFIGIAGGIKKNGVKIGDVIIPKEIVYYTISKEENKSIEIRPSNHQTDAILYDHMRNLPSSDEDKLWSQPLSLLEDISEILSYLDLESVNDLSPNVHCGTIFSGDVVIKNPDKVDELLKLSPKGLGIEMESWGSIITSFRDINRPRFIAIRGVSDLADKPNKKKWNKFHRYAADVATCYLKYFLEYGTLEPEILVTPDSIKKPKYSNYIEKEYVVSEIELVKSNLIKINNPIFLWKSKTHIRKYYEISNLIENAPPYILYEDNLISFFPFNEDNPLNQFIDFGAIEKINIVDWCNEDNLVKKINQLFNQVILALCKSRSLYHDNNIISWFYPNYEGKDLVKKSWIKKRESFRNVLKYYQTCNAYFHQAFTLRTIYLNNELYFYLLPKKIFTENGFDLIDSNRAKRLEEKFRKSQMNYNQGSLNITEFWFHYLFRHKEIFSDPISGNEIIKKKREETRKILSLLETSNFVLFSVPKKPVEKDVQKTKKKISDKKSTKLM